jgi:hypothetical protein
VSATPSASASADAGEHHRRNREDRRDDPDEPAPPLTVQVKIGTATKNWEKDSFDKVPKFGTGDVGNDGEKRDTWSLRELVHTLVGPKARVVAIIGKEDSKTISRASWDDPIRTPIIHTTRRGTLKFRWADKAGKWGDADVSDVTRIEIEP